MLGYIESFSLSEDFRGETNTRKKKNEENKRKRKRKRMKEWTEKQKRSTKTPKIWYSHPFWRWPPRFILCDAIYISLCYRIFHFSVYVFVLARHNLAKVHLHFIKWLYKSVSTVHHRMYCAHCVCVCVRRNWQTAACRHIHGDDLTHSRKLKN